MTLSAPEAAKTLRLLIIDDCEDDALLLLHRFRAANYAVTWERVDNADAMRAALTARAWDLILCDHRMPRFNALAALALMQELGLDLPFIIVSGVIEEETAIAAMRAGAHDYLTKEKLERLVPAVERELREARHRAERHAALEALRESEARFRALASHIPSMVFQMVRGGDGEMEFHYVSDGSFALLGWRPDEMVDDPRRLREAIVAEDSEDFHARFDEAARRLGTFNWEGRIVTAAGDEKWTNIRCSPHRTEAGELLWEGIMSNITQNKLAELEVRRSRAQLAELSSHLQMAKEEERERIARDIHDELGGLLVAIKIESALLAGKIPAELVAQRSRARSIEKLVDDAMSTASRVARELRPGILKEFGLNAAIESHAEDFAQRTGILCEVDTPEQAVEVDEECAIALFRIFQEALTNVSKHAHATWVEVRLRPEGQAVSLEITDDGRGIVEGDLAKPRSFGLRGIRERINALGGNFDIRPHPGGGTHLCAQAPARRETVGECDLVLGQVG